MVVLVCVLWLWRDPMAMALLYTKPFPCGWLTVSRFIPLSSWQEAWQHAGRHGAGEGAKSSLYILIRGKQKETVCHTGCLLSMWDLKACPHSDTLSPKRPHFLIRHSLWARLSKTWVYGGLTSSNHHRDLCKFLTHFTHYIFQSGSETRFC